MVKDIPYFCQTLPLCRSDLQLSAAICFTVASLSQLQEGIQSFLHPEEHTYFNTLSFAKRQQSYLLGRHAAKKALCHYHPEFTATNVAIKAGIFEYPVAYYPDYKKIQISLSHSESLGIALAFPEEHPMGVDVEAIQPHHQSSIETQLTEVEKHWISQCYHTSPQILYTLFWTAKEALSKLLRTGMMSPFHIYAIKNIVKHNHYWINEFENFAQYQALSFLVDSFVCSIVYPQRTNLSINIAAIQQWIQNLNIFNKFKAVNSK